MTNPNHDSDLYLTYLHHDKLIRLPVYLVKHMEEALLVLAQWASPGVPLTLRQHFGKEDWKAISDGQPVLAGYCTAYLVAKHQVPFEAMGIHSSSKAQMYALIG